MNHKRFLAFVLALVMVFGYVPVGASAEGNAPSLPAATVTEIAHEELTFAMNFKADEVTEEQLAYYGNWYADFELTVNKDVTFNANGGADGFLSGQYDAWSENWVNVPIENVTLKAGETLKIMEYAAGMLGQSGLRLTYNDVVTKIQSFNCGVFFEEAFLEANPDLEVKLELRMYNSKNEAESYTVGETYTYDLKPDVPTASVRKIKNDDLTFAMNFKADFATEEQLAYYGNWYADFELTVNKDVTFNANGNADGYLSGQYDAWSKNWVNVPIEDVSLEAGETLRIMEYAAELLGQSGLRLTYNEVVNSIRDFDCGVFFEDTFLAANPDLEVKLELRMYNPADESESYTIGIPYIFDLVTKDVEVPDSDVEEIENADLTFAASFQPKEPTQEQKEHYGDWYADFELTVDKDVIFNADGTQDGYVSFQYAGLGADWIDIPYVDVPLKAGQSVKITELLYAVQTMAADDSASAPKLTYNDVIMAGQKVNCGVFFTKEFLADNADLDVKLELKVYNPENVAESYSVGDPIHTTRDLMHLRQLSARSRTTT